MEPKVKPDFQMREYLPHEAVRIKDIHQSYLFLKNGARPVDIYPLLDKEGIVFVFLKSETKELYEKYRRFELS